MTLDFAFYLIDHRLIALAMVAVLAVVGEIGFRAGSAKGDAPESFRSLMNGTGAATLGLLGLLLGFTLAMAIGRWDARRDIVLSESNAIGTLWLRADLLEGPVRDDIQASLREYTEARIVLGTSWGDLDERRAAQNRSETLHSEIWSAVVRAGTSETNPAILSSLIATANEVIDLSELRLASQRHFLPAPLLLLLLGIASVAIYFLAWSFGAVGYGGRVVVVSLGLLIGAVLFLIMDVNRPQRGTFKVGVETLERVNESFSGSATH